MNQSALILTQGLTTAALQCTSDHNLFLSHKITSTQQKTTNRNNQSNQTIRKNNPRNHSIKNIQKTNLQNKHDKPSHQSIVKSITRTITTNTQSLDKKHPKTKHYKHNSPSHHTPRFLNIKITAGWFAADKFFPEPTSKYSLLIKTQCNRTRKNHGQQHYEIIYYNTKKKLFIYSDNMKPARKYI